MSGSRSSRSRPGTVFIAEDEESVVTGSDIDHFLTGRFYGHLDKGSRISDSFEGLPLEQALAWARERADRIVVRVGYGPTYAIGFESGSRLPWPSEGLGEPVRRRTPDEEWKDRTDADPDATWRATLGLAPPAPPAGQADDRRRPEWDDVGASVAEELGATWSASNLDGWFAAVRSALRRARRLPPGEAGWVTTHSRQYEIQVTVRAPTAARAREAAESRVPPLPDGWSVAAFVRFEHG
jgi:hypothetical protein